MDPLKPNPFKPDNSVEDMLLYWIYERHRIYLKRALELPSPWSKDPIMSSYRFCNVYRELDRVTQWITINWRDPHRDDPDLWFAMTVARYVNEPGTMELMGYPVPWKSGRLIDASAKRKANRQNTYNAAYIISTGGTTLPKAEYLTMFFERLWIKRKELRPQKNMMLSAYHKLLIEQPGIGGFMGAQIIADLKYSPVLLEAPDWRYFAASGPGSRRGLNRVLGRDPEARFKEEEWYAHLMQLRFRLNERLRPLGMASLDAQNTQNTLCELSKYSKAYYGEGRPKQKFSPSQAELDL